MAIIACYFLNTERADLRWRGGGGGEKGGEVRCKLSQHFSILLRITGEPQKLNSKNCTSLESLFPKLFKNTTFR